MGQFELSKNVVLEGYKVERERERENMFTSPQMITKIELTIQNDLLSRFLLRKKNPKYFLRNGTNLKKLNSDFFKTI